MVYVIYYHMEFEVTLAEADQLELETVEATVTDDGTVEFLIEGTVSDVDSEILEPLIGAAVRPVAVTFQSVSNG